MAKGTRSTHHDEFRLDLADPPLLPELPTTGTATPCPASDERPTASPVRDLVALTVPSTGTAHMMSRSDAQTLAHELHEVTYVDPDNAPTLLFHVGPHSEPRANVSGSYAVITWGDFPRARLRIHHANIRQVADDLNDIADFFDEKSTR